MLMSQNKKAKQNIWTFSDKNFEDSEVHKIIL